MADCRPLQLIQVTEELAAEYERLASLVATQAAALCPDLHLDVQHVGATAVPGLLTKGDLDIIIRVDRAEFGAVVAALGGWYTSGHPDNWLAGESAAFTLPPLPELDKVAGAVQVVSVGGTHDIFLRVRDLLRQHEHWREEMNDTNRRARHLGDTQYRAHKQTVYQRLLAWTEQDFSGRDWFDFWENYRPDPGSEVEIILEYPDGRTAPASGVYRSRTVVLGGEDGEVELSDGRVLSSDTPVRVKTWTLRDLQDRRAP